MIIFARITHNDASFFKGEYYNIQFVGKEIPGELISLKDKKFEYYEDAMSLLGEYDFDLADTVYLSGGIGYRHIWMSKKLNKQK